MTMRIRRLLGEPMLHFVLIGIALFAAYNRWSPARSSGNRIVVTQGVVDDLVTQYMAARGRAPLPNELKSLIDSYVREEILYREGVTLGLDRDDIVVKRRVRQKLEVMAEEEASTAAPTDQQLEAYLAAHPAQFVQPAVVTFEQIFLGSNTSGPVVQRAVATTHDGLQRGLDPATFGQPTLLPARMTRIESDVVARSFGQRFAAALESAPVGGWSGPAESDYGLHYIRVLERTPAVMPPLADVRGQVVREWENERRQRARNDSYAKMRGTYEVRIEAALPAEPR